MGYALNVSEESLAPSLLIAMPDLLDPNFHRTVVLLVHHDEQGTVGMVLNRPTEVRASELCESLGVDWRGAGEQVVHWGGPVQPNTGWVVADTEVLAQAPEAMSLAHHLHFAGSLAALRAVAQEPSPIMRLFLGYAGWGPGQLESELAQGAWVVAPVDEPSVLLMPEDELWDPACPRLGVDPATVVATSGVH
jgi:putative transcriptional regulator